MSDTTNIYQIRIEGHLGRQWADWFDCLTITLEEDGHTLLTGPVPDQPALYGLLKKVRDLGMPLVSVNRVDPVNKNHFIQQRSLSMNTLNDISPRKAALTAGFGLLVMFFAAIFANFSVVEKLIAAGDAAATVTNIASNTSLFGFGIAGFLLVLTCDLLVAWALYVFFKPVNTNMSALAGWLRVVYALIFGVAIFGLIGIFRLVSSAEVNETMYPQILSLMNLFKYGWLVGLEFFGAHLLVLGYLAFKSGYTPKIIGVLLIVAALGYFVDTSAQLLMPNYADYKSIFMPMVALPGVISELSLCFWLLFKGGKN